MGKIDKFIKLTCLFALALLFMTAGWRFYKSAGFKQADKFNLFLPVSKDKIANGAKPDRSAKMLFVGDIMIDRNVGEKIKNLGFDYLLAGLTKENFAFKSYDIINANLEGAVTDNGDHYPPVLANDFAFSPEIAGNLKKYNFKAFNLANNHLSDQGEKGISQTRTNLAKLDFKYYGCNDGQVGECSYYIYPVRKNFSNGVYEVNGLKIGLAGFSSVYRKFDLVAAGKIISDLKAKTDAVVVNLHWGEEYRHNFNKWQSQTARSLIDAGADLIIGHHPHVVEGVEKYKNKLIFYSLGNFIFDQYFSPDTQAGLAVEFNFTSGGRIVARLMPLLSRQSQPSLMVGSVKENYLEKIADWSKGDEKLLKEIKAGEVLLTWPQL
ncbi:MAG: CapA family protein [Parcubacteria group bacterium]|nr:CapA family protein [Parcubacteria group bacterium]